MAIRILVVDDEHNIARSLARLITRMGYAAHAVNSYDEAVAHLETAPDPYQLAVIDYRMPGKGGIVLARYLRQHYPQLGTILVSAVPDVELARDGIGSADRFVAKEDGLPPLLAAIEDVLRKKATQSPLPASASSPESAELLAARFESGPLSLDFTKHRFRFGQKQLHLTPSELFTLAHLAQHANQPVTSNELSALLQSRLGNVTTADRIPVLIHALRRKLERDPSAPRHLITERGVGYYWCESG